MERRFHWASIEQRPVTRWWPVSLLMDVLLLMSLCCTSVSLNCKEIVRNFSARCAMLRRRRQEMELSRERLAGAFCFFSAKGYSNRRPFELILTLRATTYLLFTAWWWCWWAVLGFISGHHRRYPNGTRDDMDDLSWLIVSSKVNNVGPLVLSRNFMSEIPWWTRLCRVACLFVPQ